MDPRRIPELSDAAARGAARKAASDARQRSIQQAMMRSRDSTFDPDIEMLDAPPLENNRSALYGRPNTLPLPETAADLPRQTSTTLDLNGGGQSYNVDHHRAIPASAAGPLQRQLSGSMASTSYLRPVQVTNLQQGSSSSSQPSSSYVIELDDDSPLPMRHHQHPHTFSNNRRHNISMRHQDSGNLVDLTGSPSVTRLPVRQSSNRVDLDSIGSGSLSRSSSNLASRQTKANRPQQRQQQPQSSGARHRAGNSVSASSIYGDNGALQPGRLGLCANDTSGANSMFSHEAGDFLDISGLHSSRHGGNSASSHQPVHRSNLPSTGYGAATNERRGGRAASNQVPADVCCATNSEAWPNAAIQEDMDLALAMSLAAEDDEHSRRFHAMDPHMPMQFRSNRHRQPQTRASPSFFQPYSSRSDPIASIAHSMMGGGSPFDDEAILAHLMADYNRGLTAGSMHTGAGSGQQDMSYEALTNLEDVKLTAPPELLATMPLDMCLKGGQWEDKACSICQSEYEPDEVIMILPCEHHFHKECAMEWLGKHSKKCPICKESIGG